MPLVGTVRVKINNRPAVTVMAFSYDITRPTQVKSGGYGPIGTATGIATGTGSFRLAPRMENGLEFDIEELGREFSMTFDLGVMNRYALLGCVADRRSLSVDQGAGNTEVSVNFTFREEKQVR